jgi:hypothetical protein
VVASGVGTAAINRHVSALRFFFRVTLKRYAVVEHTHFIHDSLSDPIACGLIDAFEGLSASFPFLTLEDLVDDRGLSDGTGAWTCLGENQVDRVTRANDSSLWNASFKLAVPVSRLISASYGPDKSASDSGFRGKHGSVVWSKGDRARQDATFRVWQRACAFLAISGRVRACSGARAGTGQTKRSLASATAERPRRGRGLTRSQIKLSIRTNLQTWSFRTSIRRVARPSFTDVRAIEPNSAVPTRACEVTR